MLVVLKVH
jgi:hypothetical protein